MKHAFEVAASAAAARSGTDIGDAYSATELQCGGKERVPTSAPLVLGEKHIKKFNDPCRYMAERHLSKYVSSTRANSCESFSSFAEAHEVTDVFVRLIVAMERYLEPEDFTADSDGSSDSTFSDDDAGSSVEIPKLVPESADAEPLEEVGTSSAPPRVRWARAVDEYGERWKDMPACMEAMEARPRLQGATNAKALAHREAKELAEPLVTTIIATSQGHGKFMRWPLEKCASLADTT
eukprot:3126838-Pleurochrysis_carterae.AAC.1